MSDHAQTVDPRTEHQRLRLWCDGLLAWLDTREYHVGTEQCLCVERLLDHVGPTTSSDQLRTLIAPVVAKNSEQQELFYDLYREYCADVDAGVLPPPQDERKNGKSGNDPVRSLWPSRVSRVVKSAFMTFVLVGVALMIYDGQRRRAAPGDTAVPLNTGAIPGPARMPGKGTSPVIGGRNDSTVGGPDVRAVPLAELLSPSEELFEPTSWYGTKFTLVRLGAALLPLLLFLLRVLEQRKRKRAVAERDERVRPPYAVALEAPATAVGAYPLDELRNTARAVRRRQRSGVLQLSVDRSIGATISALGHPTFVYSSATRPPEYLVLIERAAPRDHQARLYDELMEWLSDEGAHVTRYYYERDPRVCFVADDIAPVRLSQLRRLHPDHRLIIIGRGADLLETASGRPARWTEALEEWSERAVLTPEAPASWGIREVKLARSFLVLPATLAGLRAFVDHLDLDTRPQLRGWRERLYAPSPPTGEFVTAAELRDYLGDADAFRWLCACAVYPELHWELTLFLATLKGLGTHALTEDTLLRLIRLPWFRSGIMPNAIRGELLEVLADERVAGRDLETQVREALVQLLDQQRIEAGSVAAMDRERELLLNRLYLYRDDPGTVGELVRQLLVGMPREQVLEDVTVVRMLAAARPHRLALLLPDRLRRALFHGADPRLGMRWGPALALALALAVGGWRGAPWVIIPEVKSLDLEPQVIAGPVGHEIPVWATASLPEQPWDGVATRWVWSGANIDIANGSSVAESLTPGALTTMSIVQRDMLKKGSFRWIARLTVGDAGSHDLEVKVGARSISSQVVGLRLALDKQHDYAVLANARRLLIEQPALMTTTPFDSVYRVVALARPNSAPRGVASGWMSCDTARVTVSDSGVVIARKPGWTTLVYQGLHHLEFVPVYATETELTSDQRVLATPIRLPEARSPEDDPRVQAMIGRAAGAFARLPRGTPVIVRISVMASGASGAADTAYVRQLGQRIAVAFTRRGADIARMRIEVTPAAPRRSSTCPLSVTDALFGQFQQMEFVMASDSNAKPVTPRLIQQRAIALRVQQAMRVTANRGALVGIAVDSNAVLNWRLVPSGLARLSGQGAAVQLIGAAPGAGQLIASVADVVDTVPVTVRPDVLPGSYWGIRNGADGTRYTFTLRLVQVSDTQYRAQVAYTRLDSSGAAVPASRREAVNGSFDAARGELVFGGVSSAGSAPAETVAYKLTLTADRRRFIGRPTTGYFFGALEFTGLAGTPRTLTRAVQVDSPLTPVPSVQLDSCAGFAVIPRTVDLSVLESRALLMQGKVSPSMARWISLSPAVNVSRDGKIVGMQMGRGTVVVRCGSWTDSIRVVVRNYGVLGVRIDSTVRTFVQRLYATASSVSADRMETSAREQDATASGIASGAMSFGAATGYVFRRAGAVRPLLLVNSVFNVLVCRNPTESESFALERLLVKNVGVDQMVDNIVNNTALSSEIADCVSGTDSGARTRLK